MSADRLARILEQCRSEFHPELSADLVAEAASIQARNQFSDRRDAARREMRELIAHVVTHLPQGGGTQ
jgi:hypothetical protein